MKTTMWLMETGADVFLRDEDPDEYRYKAVASPACLDPGQYVVGLGRNPRRALEQCLNACRTLAVTDDFTAHWEPLCLYKEENHQ